MIFSRRDKPRRGPLRDEHYLAFLREEGICVACAANMIRSLPTLSVAQVTRNLRRSNVMCQAAHGPVNGRSSKGPDNEAVPLCANHHQEQTAIGWPAFENKYRFSRQHEAAIWYDTFRIWESFTGANPA